MTRRASNVVPIRTRPARYSAAIAAEGWMEVAEAARQVIAASVFVGTDWVYEDAPLPDGPSAPVAA